MSKRSVKQRKAEVRQAMSRFKGKSPRQIDRICEAAVEKLLEMALDETIVIGAMRHDDDECLENPAHLERHMADPSIDLGHKWNQNEPSWHDAYVNDTSKKLKKRIATPFTSIPSAPPVSLYGTNGRDAKSDMSKATAILVTENADLVKEWLKTAIELRLKTDPSEWPQKDELPLRTDGFSPSQPRSANNRKDFADRLKRHGLDPISSTKEEIASVWPYAPKTLNMRSAIILERKTAQQEGDPYHLLCPPISKEALKEMPVGTNFTLRLHPTDMTDPEDHMSADVLAWNTVHATLTLQFDPTSETLATPVTLYPSIYTEPQDIDPDVLSPEEIDLRHDGNISHLIGPAYALLMRELSPHPLQEARDANRHLVSPEEPLVIATTASFAAEGPHTWHQRCDLRRGTLDIRHIESGWTIHIDDTGTTLVDDKGHSHELPLSQEKVMTSYQLDRLTTIPDISESKHTQKGFLNTHYIDLLHKMPSSLAHDLKSVEATISMLADKTGHPDRIPTPKGLPDPYPCMGSTNPQLYTTDRIMSLKELMDQDPSKMIAPADPIRAEAWERQTYGDIVEQPLGITTIYEQTLTPERRRDFQDRKMADAIKKRQAKRDEYPNIGISFDDSSRMTPNRNETIVRTPTTAPTTHQGTRQQTGANRRGRQRQRRQRGALGASIGSALDPEVLKKLQAMSQDIESPDVPDEKAPPKDISHSRERQTDSRQFR